MVSEKDSARSAWTFLREFTKRPKDMGSVIPSSVHLARQMVLSADLRDEHTVVELGAGTGAITSEIRTAVPEAELLCLEPNSGLADVLRRRFPELRVAEHYAGPGLPEVIAGHGLGLADRVVSALPWTMWGEDVQHAIFEGIVEAMCPQGRFVTYSYITGQMFPNHVVMRNQLHRRFRRVRQTKPLWSNFPPATVYVCEEPLPIPPHGYSRTG